MITAHLLRMIGLGIAVVVALIFAVLVGDLGPWYFAWVIGTVMIILIAGAGTIMLDTQQQLSGSEEI
ncbi:MAG: hypothetical protein LKH33_05185 [Acetobacter sp.]|jgi:small-conductance mechanosensitive channel|nr:hypothetical protein [Acetobacter sp.]MCH4062134.1 hypothetical protein [Acetobacter sp.]MCH4089019.1 hypothetical protein [Acetobacter sp.]MCI1293257.1 hypothetical protein [Acetobacter sp.]MCI1320120.1 hypothetical protein [Acetobacter sp.]